MESDRRLTLHAFEDTKHSVWGNMKSKEKSRFQSKKTWLSFVSDEKSYKMLSQKQKVQRIMFKNLWPGLSSKNIKSMNVLEVMIDIIKPSWLCTF